MESINGKELNIAHIDLLIRNKSSIPADKCEPWRGCKEGHWKLPEGIIEHKTLCGMF